MIYKNVRADDVTVSKKRTQGKRLGFAAKQTFYNTWEHKLSIIKYTDIYIIALHRLSIYVLDLPYKENLFNFYKNIYNENELNIIKNIFI